MKINIGGKVEIKSSSTIVSELWGRSGIIKEILNISHEDTRKFYGRTYENCPDDCLYVVQLDQTILMEGNLKGWNIVKCTLDDLILC